uniref:Uncharacterized protein n=1 Tax=Lotharella oceanica TaxID=641309 RepID=A0A7S2TYT2_9EUKA
MDAGADDCRDCQKDEGETADDARGYEVVVIVEGRGAAVALRGVVIAKQQALAAKHGQARDHSAEAEHDRPEQHQGVHPLKGVAESLRIGELVVEVTTQRRPNSMISTSTTPRHTPRVTLSPKRKAWERLLNTSMAST